MGSSKEMEESKGQDEQGQGRLLATDKVRESIRLPEPPTSMTFTSESHPNQVVVAHPVHLLVEGKIIECDLDPLVEKSSLIREMYDVLKPPDPSHKPKIEQLPIGGPVSYDTMVWVVKYIESLVDSKIVKEENYKILLEAADYLGIESLSNQCKEFIIDGLNFSNCMDRWTFFGTRMGLVQFRKLTEDYMSAVFFELIQSAFSKDVTEACLMKLLERKDLKVPETMSRCNAEDAIFSLVAQWAQHPERNLQSGAVFRLVQYHLLNEDQLRVASDKLDSLQSSTGVDFSDVKALLIIPAMEYTRLGYEDELNYWSDKPKPGRWPYFISPQHPCYDIPRGCRSDMVPVEFFFKAFDLLPPRDLKMASMVCKRWNNATGCPSLWKWCKITVRNRDDINNLSTRRLLIIDEIDVNTGALEAGDWEAFFQHVNRLSGHKLRTLNLRGEITSDAMDTFITRMESLPSVTLIRD